MSLSISSNSPSGVNSTTTSAAAPSSTKETSVNPLTTGGVDTFTPTGNAFGIKNPGPSNTTAAPSVFPGTLDKAVADRAFTAANAFSQLPKSQVGAVNVLNALPLQSNSPDGDKHSIALV